MSRMVADLQAQTLYLFAHAQAMDLSVDLWRIIKGHLTRKEWGKARGTSLASYSLQWPLLAAEVHNTPGDDRHDLMRQLQLDRWPAFQSLRLDLWHLCQALKLTPDQVEELDLASTALPLLQCLHIIGRDQAPLTHSSAEGVLVRLLARHASLLTLQVKTVTMPLDLPTLQHLVLDLDADPTGQGHRQTHKARFSAISVLKGLNTLYIQSHRTAASGPPTIKNGTDLTGWAHLQHIALQDVRLEGMVVLPAGCLLHATCERTQVSDYVDPIAQLVTGLTLRQAASRKLNQHGKLSRNSSVWLLGQAPDLHNLKRLRVTLTRENFSDQYRGEGELHVHIGWSMPSLEVLELDIHHNLVVSVTNPWWYTLKLIKLVLITTGTLELHLIAQHSVLMNTANQMYLQSGAAFPPGYRSTLQTFYARNPQEEMKLLDYVREGQDFWMAQMPSSFHPGSLQVCCCKACPECLARAGVPVICDQEWTHDRFSRHSRLRP